MKWQQNKNILLLTLIICTVPLLCLFFIYKVTSNVIIGIIATIFCCITFLVGSIILITAFTHLTNTMIDEYKKNKDLIMGTLAIVSISICIVLLLSFLSEIIYRDQPQNTLSDIVKIITSILPASLSLLGVHYSTSIQNKNRKEDLISLHKPYLLVEYYVCFNNCEPDLLNIRINNLTDNVCVPLYIFNFETKLDYFPINKQIYGEYTIRMNKITYYNIPYINPIKLYFKDALNNLYKTDLTLNFKIDAGNKKQIAYCSEPILISNNADDYIKSALNSKNSKELT